MLKKMARLQPLNPCSGGGLQQLDYAVSTHDNDNETGGFFGNAANASFLNCQHNGAGDGLLMMVSDDVNGFPPQFPTQDSSQLHVGIHIDDMANATELQPHTGTEVQQRSLKLKRQHSDSGLGFHQQQNLPPMSLPTLQSSQQQQRKKLQQQIFRFQLQQNQLHKQQQLHRLGGAKRPNVNCETYEPGKCAQRLSYYMRCQQHRPEDNNIEYWRSFVADFFTPYARKRWCVSLYCSGHQTTGAFSQDVWHCDLCKCNIGRGFEATAEVLPRLLQVDYASGTLEELLYIDMPQESQNSSGEIVLDYSKAVQESVFEHLRVVREGHLRIVFSPDLKICSWQFCARQQHELIPRRLYVSEVSQLGAVVQKYQTLTQNASSTPSAEELQNTSDSFVACARQLAKPSELPVVNELGHTKNYLRCLQIAAVVNRMKPLIDFSCATGIGPKDSLINFVKRASASPGQLEHEGRTMQILGNYDQSSIVSTEYRPVNDVLPSCNALPAGRTGLYIISTPNSVVRMNSAGSVVTMPVPPSSATGIGPKPVLQMTTHLSGMQNDMTARNGTTAAFHVQNRPIGRANCAGTGGASIDHINGMGHQRLGGSTMTENARNMNEGITVNHASSSPSTNHHFVQHQQDVVDSFGSGLGLGQGKWIQ